MDAVGQRVGSAELGGVRADVVLLSYSLETVTIARRRRPWDHLDLVLGRAVLAAVIGPEDSLLIGLTRLEDVPLHEVADHLGISTTTAATWRHRAEQHLKDAIEGGELQYVDL
jgi:hypothetical protein